jgi:hypothetical protein
MLLRYQPIESALRRPACRGPVFRAADLFLIRLEAADAWFSIMAISLLLEPFAGAAFAGDVECSVEPMTCGPEFIWPECSTCALIALL